MAKPHYPMPAGMHAISPSKLDLRPDPEIDQTLLHPPPVTTPKNIWFFWKTGYSSMHSYTQRNVRAWHRRLTKRGWTIRILDLVPSSRSHVSNFLPISDPSIFPLAFTEGTLTGPYAAQHTSDLVRWPLLLRYGGVYADVGMIQIGDLDRLWHATIGDAASPYEVLSYNAGGVTGRSLTNYFLASLPHNPLFERCHKLLLALWASEGGKTSTEGMHKSTLLRGVPLMGATFNQKEDISAQLTDYIIQGQVMTMVMSLVDPENENDGGGWDGPRYVVDHIYAIEFMEGSQMVSLQLGWNGQRAYELMSLPIPLEDEPESDDQKAAHAIIQACLTRSFGFKLAHGLILKVYGETLGSLWRKHAGSDDVPGTYAGWLRYATVYWEQDHLPSRLEFEVLEPLKRGALLRES